MPRTLECTASELSSSRSASTSSATSPARTRDRTNAPELGSMDQCIKGSPRVHAHSGPQHNHQPPANQVTILTHTKAARSAIALTMEVAATCARTAASKLHLLVQL